MQVVNFASYPQAINVTINGKGQGAWELETDAEMVSGPYAEAENSFDDPEQVCCGWNPALMMHLKLECYLPLLKLPLSAHVRPV